MPEPSPVRDPPEIQAGTPGVAETSSKRVLEPEERIAEVLFGLIMVLSFTGSLSVADAGSDKVRTMLIGALGCNFAWGIIDGLFYLMSCLSEKGFNLQKYHAVRGAKDATTAQSLIASALPPIIARLLQPGELEAIHQRLLTLPEPPKYARLDRRDLAGAIGVFLLVFLATFPVAIPFAVLDVASQAMRVSNAIAVAMLFVTGVAYGRIVGRSPLAFGIAMVILGGTLVAFTIAFGG